MERKKVVDQIIFFLSDGSQVRCKEDQWKEEIKTNREGYTNHFHLITKTIEDSSSEVIEELIIPQSAVLKILIQSTMRMKEE